MAPDDPPRGVTPKVRPLVLCILDGWGIAPDGPANALSTARTPNWDRFLRDGVSTQLGASGAAVGLPEGQMGNSEVGHLNIGAGQIVFQDIVRIDQDIRSRAFSQNPVLAGVMDRTRDAGKTLHLLGLVGPGGVHSHERHMDALLAMARAHSVDRVAVHAVLDGRDTPPRSAAGFLATLQRSLAEHGGAISTIQGRYWAMDRDQRWERTESAYHALVDGAGRRAPDAQTALSLAYEAGENDEFVQPTLLDGARLVTPGDGFVFVNFRPDRARQLTRALAEPGFDAFPVKPLGLDFVCMTRYQAGFEDFAAIAYPPAFPEMSIGLHLSTLGLRQLRIAETEKYAHVTYFLSGGREETLPGEDRILVPSPKVATYDLQPEMSAPEVTERLVAVLRGPDPPDFVALNFANPDMVGHTGVLDAARHAVEVIDTALGQLDNAVREAGGLLAVTADHGNVEHMVDADGEPVTKHTTNPVPLVLVADEKVLPPEVRLREGVLADVAPTLLDIMGLPKPSQMDRESLLIRP